MHKVLVVLAGLVSIGMGCEGDEKASVPHARFAVLGDRTGMHKVDINNIDIHKLVLDAVQYESPEFVVSVGDMIEGYTEAKVTLETQWDEYFSLYDSFPVPAYYTPGNHDLFFEGQEESYQRYVGEPYYSIEFNNIKCIVLNNSRWAPGEQLLDSIQYTWLKKFIVKRLRSCSVIYHIGINLWMKTNQPTVCIRYLRNIM